MANSAETIELRAEQDIYLLSLAVMGADEAVIHAACEAATPENFVALTPETQQRYIEGWGEERVTNAVTYLKELDKLRAAKEAQQLTRPTSPLGRLGTSGYFKVIPDRTGKK